MDTITHSLVGCAFSDACFRKRLGPAATPFALAVSALPDADMFTFFISSDFPWAHHRGYSHSFFPMLLAAPLLGYAGYRLAKKSGAWGYWTLLALVCLFSHTIIDLATSWGTMPLLPFSNARISWDIAPILDIFTTSVAGFSFVLNRWLRHERVDPVANPVAYPIVHTHSRRRRAADTIGRAAAVLLVCYLLLGWHQNRQTVDLARRCLTDAGVDAAEVRALPIMFTYIAWDIAARDASGTVYNAVHSSYAPRPMRFIAVPTEPGPLVERVLASRAGGMLAWYAQGMFVAASERSEAGNRVRLSDRRFFTLSNPLASRFVTEFDVNPLGEVTPIKPVRRGLGNMDLGEELRLLWRLSRYGEAPAVDAAATIR